MVPYTFLKEVLVAELKKPTEVALPFRCHGLRLTMKDGQATELCDRKLARGEAWVPDLGTLRKVLGHMPGVSDLKDHAHCGHCAHVGRKAGLRFYLHDSTVLELERRRTADVAHARQRFGHYLR